MVGLREPRGGWTQGKRAAERHCSKLWISWLNSSGMAAGWSHREFRRQIQWVWAPTEAKKKGKAWDFLFLVFCIFYSAELKTWTSNWRPIPQTQPKLNQEVNHWWKQRLVKVTSNISRDLKPKWRIVYYGVSKTKREKKEKSATSLSSPARRLGLHAERQCSLHKTSLGRFCTPWRLGLVCQKSTETSAPSQRSVSIPGSASSSEDKTSVFREQDSASLNVSS